VLGDVVFAANGTLDYAPHADASGNDSFSYTVTAGGSNETGQVTVSVVAVNDAPSLDPIADGAAVIVGSAPVQVALSGIGPGMGDPQQSLVLSALSDTPTVVPDPQVSYTSPQGNAQLLLSPLAVGTAQITVMLVDDGGTANGGVDTRTRIFTQRVVSENVFANQFE